MKCTKKKKSIYYNRNSEFIGDSNSDFAKWGDYKKINPWIYLYILLGDRPISIMENLINYKKKKKIVTLSTCRKQNSFFFFLSFNRMC